MRTIYGLTTLQKEIVSIVKGIDEPYSFGEKVGVTGRAISYWQSGQRPPRDLNSIELVLDALGYELKVVKK